jgi:hypothetical protein
MRGLIAERFGRGANRRDVRSREEVKIVMFKKSLKEVVCSLIGENTVRLLAHRPRIDREEYED